MKLLSRVRTLAADNWLTIMLYAILAICFGWLLWWQLGALTAGYSFDELRTLTASSSLERIWNNPLNAPFTLLAYGMVKIGGQSLFLMRLTAVVFGLLTLAAFYGILRYWHGERSAILGTIIFGVSAWFLHAARLGTPDILFFLLLAFVACGTWLVKSNNPGVLLLCFLLGISLIYTPGMVWFVLLATVWQLKRIDKIFKQNLGAVSLGALVVLAALVPLGLAIYQNPELAKQVAGLPQDGWPKPLAVLRSLAEVPVNLVLRGPFDPQHWLGRLPVLDAFVTAMFGLGGYLYIRHLKLKRSKLLAGILILGTILISLGGETSLSIIVPFVYIVAAAGVGFMLDYWYTVFPRNVIARGVGFGLLCLTVLACCWYNLRSYFVAWPNASATKQVYTIQPLPTDKK